MLCVSTSPEVTSQEVEFLSPSLAPAQVAMRQESGLGCLVFDSPMLKLAFSCYLQSMVVWKEYCGLTSPRSLCLLYKPMLGDAASILDEGPSVVLCGTSPLGGVLPQESGSGRWIVAGPSLFGYP